MKRIKILIMSIIIALTLGFIWGNSCVPQVESAKESSAVYEAVKPVFDVVPGEGIITHEIFRKMAHAYEFMILCLEVNILFYFINEKFSPITFFLSLASCLFVAGIDETIQIFSSRGPSLTDVAIDFGGCVIASVFILCVYLIVRLFRVRQR